ncbi:unnamed protein product [Cuscuta europaea]|uniref:Pentatricopeptide repeat-containing protein n=1 Tax=Cuscuta europaea TaxID=41803 RepID=A0A9P0YUQ6_CUSEU|nr:unnamed protein product [Cuscuta europaea]
MSSLGLRHARRLCTTPVAKHSAQLSISQIKNKLRHEHDPDVSVQMYNSLTSSNEFSTSNAFFRYAQESTVRRLAKFHRFTDIESFINSQKSIPQITEEPFLSSLIRCYGIAGMFDNALKLFDEMPELGTPRSSISFNALLTACVHSKQPEHVLECFNKVPVKYGVAPDKFSYGILINVYSEMGSLEMAMEKLREMEEKGIEVTPVTFTTILHGLYKNGRIDEAERFWNDMVKKNGSFADVVAYNVRLMHIHEGEVEMVKALIEEMLDAGLNPDAISYNCLISCYCKKGMMDEAKKVYDTLGSKGCSPNIATFKTLLFYLCKQGRYMTAYKVFKTSVKVHKLPDFDTLKCLAEGLVNDGRNVEVKGMIRTLNKKLPPNLLKDWGKFVDDLGFTPMETKKVDSGAN